MFEIKICHLYPDLLNLYGDRGNIIALTKRCQWRGIQVSYHSISLGDTFDPEAYDIVFMGGGQDYEQGIIQDDLMGEKRKRIIEAVRAARFFWLSAAVFSFSASITGPMMARRLSASVP
jgi:CobQ-like glutamine amidotransferase family enzyme